MPNNTIHVVAGVLVRDGLFLVAKRMPGGPAGGQWEFPGGKVEAGEAPQQALQRELKEELNLDVAVGEQLGLFKAAIGAKVIALDCYWVRQFQGDIQISSHSEFAWVKEADLFHIDFAEPDLPAVISILARGA